MKILDLNVISFMVMISSIALVLYPFVQFGIADHAAKVVSHEFEKVEFALRHFFYVEGFGIVSPSSVGIKTLVQRYYLSKDPGEDYSIFWMDPDPSDGIVKAIIVYHGEIDPVAAMKVMKGLVWFDEKEKSVNRDYRRGRKVGVVVEVSGD